MREVLASLAEFCGKVARHWYVFGVGVIGGLLGLASGIYAESHPKAAPLIPTWIWLTLLAGGLLVAILWAFHDVRRERDDARVEIQRRFDALRYALRMTNIASHSMVGPDRVLGEVRIAFTLTNTSDEYFRFEFEEASATIDGRQSTDEDPTRPNGEIIAPHSSEQYLCPPVTGIPAIWRNGSLKISVKYGHPPALYDTGNHKHAALSFANPLVNL